MTQRLKLVVCHLITDYFDERLHFAPGSKPSPQHGHAPWELQIATVCWAKVLAQLASGF
jgi:hypothetical protein